MKEDNGQSPQQQTQCALALQVLQQPGPVSLEECCSLELRNTEKLMVSEPVSQSKAWGPT